MNIYLLGSCRIYDVFTKRNKICQKYKNFNRSLILMHTLSEIIFYLEYIFGNNKEEFKNFHESSVHKIMLNKKEDELEKHKNFIINANIIFIENASLKNKIKNKIINENDLYNQMCFLLKKYFKNKKVILCSHINIYNFKIT